MLRTPLLPFDLLPANASDIHRLLSRPEVREALFLASPSLYRDIPLLLESADQGRRLKIERALSRYLTRMCGRPTPFGLLAGYSVGHELSGEETAFEIAPLEMYRRRSRVDMNLLYRVSNVVMNDPTFLSRATFRANDCIYFVGNTVRFVQIARRSATREYRLVSIERSPEIELVVRQTRSHGRTREQLVRDLITDEVSQEEATAFVDEVIREQIVLPEVQPLLTGDDAATLYVKELLAFDPHSEQARLLSQAVERLVELDARSLGAEPASYPIFPNTNSPEPGQNVVQADIEKPLITGRIGTNVVDEVNRAVQVLHRIMPDVPDPLREFRRRFSDRFGEREVPLLEALDDDYGVGALVRRHLPDPIVQALETRRSGSTKSFTQRDRHLLKLVIDAARERKNQVSITEDDIQALESQSRPPLPDAFQVIIKIAARSSEDVARGEFKIVVSHGIGPSGARLLSRIALGDPTLADCVRGHLRLEEAAEPDAVFAEIVHPPAGRLANVAARPVLREYELTVLGRSGAASDRQLPLSDLLITVRGDQVVLRSRTLGRRVIPRLTSAHNYLYNALPVYNFLCNLQFGGGVVGITWSWGVAADLEFLPRVCYGKSILSPAKWNISSAAIRAWRKSLQSGTDVIEAFRERFELPQWISLEEGDVSLPLNLTTEVGRNLISPLIQRENALCISELLPSPDELLVAGPEGRFTHDIVVPLNRETDRRTHSNIGNDVVCRSRRERRFSFGSEWLFAKLYCGPYLIDRVLRSLQPFIRQATEDESITKWFFIRYGDPDWHVRLRVCGRPDVLVNDVAPQLGREADRLMKASLIWRAQFDTYEREIERYGNELIEHVEDVFHADSAFVASAIALPELQDPSVRFELMLLGVHSLLCDFGLTLNEREGLTRNFRRGLAERLDLDKATERAMGSRYREAAARLSALIADPGYYAAPWESSLRLRSQRLRSIAASMREDAGARIIDIVASLAHMHANRMCQTNTGPNELLVYDFLSRVYCSQRIQAGA